MQTTSFKLFWQYPVITELTFYNQNKLVPNYLGIPWATIIDKKINLNDILKYIISKNLIKTESDAFTCCQHIYFRNLVQLWKLVGIKRVYTPHKVIGEDVIDGIQILPCPLYAVSIEDESRNKMLKGVDVLACDRPILYSFVGAYQPENYLTKIRCQIFELPNREDVYIKNTGEWHFNKVVYTDKQNSSNELNIDHAHLQKTYEYNELLLKSRYTLAPSGAGPNSIRFWEALGTGSIPVLLADTLELPENEVWNSAIVRIPEKDVGSIDEVLSKITKAEEYKKRQACLKIYHHFRNNYRNNSYMELKYTTITIELPTSLVSSHFKCFVHFVADHLFLLFKIQHYLSTVGIAIDSLNICCNQTDVKPFMIDLYRMLFSNVTFNKRADKTFLDLGVILGSIENTETRKIYLSKSQYLSSLIPKNLYENSRKLSTQNSEYAKLFKNKITDACATDDTIINQVLIINRSENGRKWNNMSTLTSFLKSINMPYSIENLEHHTMRKQIQLIHSSKFIIFPSGSSQGHLFWANPKSTCIECHIPGHRYINSILYAKKLNLNLNVLFEKSTTKSIASVGDLPLKYVLLYQMHSSQILNSRTITNTEIANEIDWFELLLSPSCSEMYTQQYHKNINLESHIGMIQDIITRCQSRKKRIVFFTTCKPFIGDDAWRQEQAVKSWSLLTHQNFDIKIVVIGNDEGVSAICEKYGAIHRTDVKTYSNVPYLHSMFDIACEYVVDSEDVLIWTNADMIYNTDLISNIVAFESYKSANKIKNFALIGQRYDWHNPSILHSLNKQDFLDNINITEREITITPHGPTGKMAYMPIEDAQPASVKYECSLHQACGIDYVVFNKDTLLGKFDKNLVIAGARHDMIVVGAALQSGFVFDISATNFVVHQDHGYYGRGDLVEVLMKNNSLCTGKQHPITSAQYYSVFTQENNIQFIKKNQAL